MTPSPPASTSTSPHEMAPHLPAPTSVPLPGPSEPVKLACPPNLGNEADLEKTVADLTTALQMMDMDDGAGSPQPAVAETKVADGSKGKSQLTLKDMPAAVWLPRLKKGSVDTPPVAVEDKTGVLRAVAGPHVKAPPGIPSLCNVPAAHHDSTTKDPWSKLIMVL